MSLDTAYPDDRDEWYANRGIEPNPMTAADEHPNPLLAKPLGPDPWDVWVCSCGETTDTQPQTCGACGWVNWGGAA